MLPSHLVIRPVVVEDIPRVLAFLAKKAEFDGVSHTLRATAERLRLSLFADPPQLHVIFAEVDGQAVGFASYYFTYSTFLASRGIWLDDLYVNADVRSRGIGRSLLVHIARLARSLGCERLEWTAALTNVRALAFYRKHGAAMSETTCLCRLDATSRDRLIEAAEALNDR